MTWQHSPTRSRRNPYSGAQPIRPHGLFLANLAVCVTNLGMALNPPTFHVAHSAVRARRRIGG